MADRTEKIILQVELDVEQLKKDAANAREQLSGLKSEQRQLNDELTKLEKAGQKGSVAYTNLNEKLVTNSVATKAVTKEVNGYINQLVIAEQRNKSAGGSYENLLRNYQLASIELKNLAGTLKLNEDGTFQLTDEFKKASAEVARAKEAIIAFDQSISDGRSNVGNYASGFKTFRQEIAEARNEAKQISETFGAQSKEAVEATKHVNELADKFELFQRIQKGVQEGGKFEAIGKTISGFAGGFAAAQGALALFGSESEDVNKALLKVQATIALMQGLKEFSKLGKDLEALLPILGLTKSGVQQVAVAEGQLTVAEGAAATGAKATGVALNSMLGPLGLILIAGTAVAAMLESLGDSAKIKSSIDKLIKDIEGENDAHKLTIEQLKLKSDAYVTEAENALATAQQKKQSAEQIAALEKNIVNEKNVALRNELQENQAHLDELVKQRQSNAILLKSNIDDEQREKLNQLDKENEAEIAATVNANLALLNEHKKLANQLILIDAEAADKRIEEQNKISEARIGVIRDDFKRELAQIKQSGKEKLDAIKDDEANAGEQRKLIALDTQQKISDAVRAHDLQLLKERNDLNIAKTREGTQARIDAEINAAKTERDELLKNDKLTATQREAIAVDAENKIRKLGSDSVALKIANDRKIIEAEIAKQQGLADAQSTDAVTPEQKFAAELNQLNISTQAKIAVLQNEAEEQKRIAKEKGEDTAIIDKEFAGKSLSILANDTAAKLKLTQDFNAQSRQLEAERLQTIADAQVDPFLEIDARAAALEQNYQNEIAAAKTTGADTAAIELKYAKLRENIERDRVNTTVGLVQKGLELAGELLADNADAAKALAVSGAIINTYQGAAAAVSPPPVGAGPLLGPILAALTIATGFLTVAKIANTPVPKLREGGPFDWSTAGGFTGEGNPSHVSTTLGAKPYEYHRSEYIIPEPVLKHPAVNSLVFDMLEPMRKNITLPVGKLSRRGFQTGGIADITTTQIVQSVQQISRDDISSAMTDAVKALPPIIAVIEDINVGQGRVINIEQRANI